MMISSPITAPTFVRSIHASRAAWLALALAVTAPSGCGGGSGDPDAGVDIIDGAPAVDADPTQCEGDIRRIPAIYNGTALPTYVPLSDGQIMAIGTFSFCTGTLIAPSFVLTAEHCEVSTSDQFCIGAVADTPNICFDVAATTTNPNGDMTLVDLGVDARVTAPAVEPIPILTEVMDETWIGNAIEIAGYGEQEDSSSGEREFAAQILADLEDGEFLTVDGGGAHGACWGDSGGPAMVVASDSSVRVAGDLSWGDPSCLDQDHYARTDTMVAWIESFTGPTVVGPGPYPCGAITEQGRCLQSGGVAIWCDETLQREACGAGESCGWDTAASGYRCVTGADPCGGTDEFGMCDGNVARWCESGVAKHSDCSTCDSLCQLTASAGGAICVPDPCMGIDYLGTCQGNIAVWCDGGELNQRDCSAEAKVCQYVDENVGYWCV